MLETKPPFPPFTQATALQKVQTAEDAWNTKDAEKVCMAYTPDSVWRNRNEFISGRDQIKKFLERKWEAEREYRLKKWLWAFHGNRISAKFEYEWHDQQKQWHRSYGNEQWEFAPNGLMQVREASINDIQILESERRL